MEHKNLPFKLIFGGSDLVRRKAVVIFGGHVQFKQSTFARGLKYFEKLAVLFFLVGVVNCFFIVAIPCEKVLLNWFTTHLHMIWKQDRGKFPRYTSFKQLLSPGADILVICRGTEVLIIYPLLFFC